MFASPGEACRSGGERAVVRVQTAPVKKGGEREREEKKRGVAREGLGNTGV